MQPNFLDEIVQAQKRGERRGIPSICSAHPWVLKAAMYHALQESLKVSPSGTMIESFRVLLIESTCNQVNQFGGYTGMTPAAFGTYVNDMAAETGFPPVRLVLGGDHLGPGPWQDEPAKSAMQKATDMVQAYGEAGFTKLHLDASMKLGDDDPIRPLDLELSARRTACLAQAAERACLELGSDCKPRYVIGSEVPTPGGATAHEDGVHVTRVEAARCTLELMQTAFLGLGLDAAWERVIAMVVQPGVEFGDDFVLDYNPAAASPLARFAETIPFVYEAHSTDYQTGEALRELVRDHFAILKVGPALTFAFREAVFALAWMEDELVLPEERSDLIKAIDRVMLKDPANWINHYHGSANELRFARKYSLSDRMRYYWGDPQVQAAMGRLIQNLAGKPLPLSLVSQFLPGQAEKIRCGQIDNTPVALVQDKIQDVLESYAQACR